MKRIIIALAVFVSFTACTKEGIEDENKLAICFPSNDTIVYKGTFERSSLSGVQTADVTLKFKDGVFVGNSSKQLFPAIGTGTVSSSNASTITFRNQSMWTANFDWTLILDGTFDVTAKGDSLRFSKFKGYDWVDSYNLKRQ
jgi:hypothetical protein